MKKSVTTNSGESFAITTDESTPILNSGHPDLSKLTASLIIPNTGNMKVEVLDSKYIDYEYIEGVDGSLLDKTTLGPDIINENCTFTKSSLGSALSHRKLWEKCIELNEPIHIMEDDAIVHSEFNSYLSKLDVHDMDAQ